MFYILIIFFTLGVLFMLYITGGEFTIALPISMLSTTLLLGIFLITSSSVYDKYETIDIKEDEMKISALSTSSNNHGHFFIGSGEVNQNLVYYYMLDTDKGTTINHVDAEESYIKESNDNPKVIKYSEKLKNPMLNFIYKDFNVEYHTFYVPNNTIDNNFNVNLDNNK